MAACRSLEVVVPAAASTPPETATAHALLARRQSQREDRAAAIANFPVVRAVDAAEAQGDAHRALDLIGSDLERRTDTKTFWHPARLNRLLQLAVFDGVLPGWAYSRWILAQAVRWMDASQRTRFTRAFDRTVQVAGGPDRYAGVDEIDSQCKLMDHDWVYRQLVLYEYGGLQHFLDHVASRELLERAEGIREWAHAPMRAYVLKAQTSSTLRWLDLASREEVETANVGSASLLEIDDHAIGRLVPTEGGPMFESAPIFVPPDVATWVTDAPCDWMSALQRGCHRETSPGQRISTAAPSYPLLCDVPVALELALVEAVVDPSVDEVRQWSVDDWRRACSTVLRAALSESPVLTDSPFNPWPVLGSMVLEPRLFVELVRHPLPEDEEGFARMAARLSSPADQACRMLAMNRGAAA